MQKIVQKIIGLGSEVALAYLELGLLILDGETTASAIIDAFDEMATHKSDISKGVKMAKAYRKSASYRKAFERGEFTNINSAYSAACDIIGKTATSRKVQSPADKLAGQFSKLSKSEQAKFLKLIK